MTTDANDGVPIFYDEDAARLVAQDFDHQHNEAARFAFDAMRSGYTASELDGYETLSQGQADDLKHETADGVRYWLSRTGVADGEPFENTVSIEVERGGSWVTIAKYDGGELDDDDDEGEGEGEGWRCRDCERSNAEGAEFCAFCGQERPSWSAEVDAERFTLGIALGNAAMQDRDDVARALRAAADSMQSGVDAEGAIRDDNGNTVGRWVFGDDEAKDYREPLRVAVRCIEEIGVCLPRNESWDGGPGRLEDIAAIIDRLGFKRPNTSEYESH